MTTRKAMMAVDGVAPRRAETPSLDPSTFLQEMLVRNAGVLTPREQALVSAARVVVAGCGSVGGSIVDPLTRLGVGELVFADPDSYDVTNLNRQAAVFADVGRNKAEVQAERAKAINPFVGTSVFPEGITDDNAGDVVRGASVIFDAVDIAEGGLRWKYLLHEEAARRRIPVISGIDTAGKAVVYVFDYRHEAPPFYGKCRRDEFFAATAAGPGSGESARAVRGWIKYPTMPADFLALARQVLTTGISWPQVSYAVAGLGAIACRLVVDLLVGRPVRYMVASDLHDLPRRRSDRSRARARWVAEVVRSAHFLLRPPARSQAADDGSVDWPSSVSAVADAIRRAPSIMNTQPWRMAWIRRGILLVRPESSRLPRLDPDHRLYHLSLGCALEAATSIANVEFEATAASSAGALGLSFASIDLRASAYARNEGVLRARATNRHPFATESLPVAWLKELEHVAELHGSRARVLADRRVLRLLSALVRDSASDDRDWSEEEARWWRLRDGDPVAGRVGLSPAELGMRRMHAAAARRRPAVTPALAARQRRRSASLIDRSGAALLLQVAGPGSLDWLHAGRAMMAIWLAATRAGFAVQPLRIPLRDGPAIGSLFETDGDAPAPVLLRIGYQTRLPAPSSRLSLLQLSGPA